MHPFATAPFAVAIMAAFPRFAVSDVHECLSISGVERNGLLTLAGLCLCLTAARWWHRRRPARTIVLTLS
jgi:hypothetical protein